MKNIMRGNVIESRNQYFTTLTFPNVLLGLNYKRQTKGIEEKITGG